MGSLGDFVEEGVGEVDMGGVAELVLPVDGVLAAFRSVGVMEGAAGQTELDLEF